MAVERGRAALSERVHKVLELAAMALDADGARAARAGAEDVRLGGADGVVLGARVLKVPAHDAIVFERDGAVLPANLEAPRPARPQRGARLERAEGAACESERGARGVLDVDAGVHATRRPREDFRRHSDEPQQEVDAVDGLVDHRPAAVVGVEASRRGVVLRVAVPLHVGAREHEATEPAGIERGLDGAGAIAKAALEDRRDAQAGGVGGADDLVRAGSGDLDRFLDDEVLARANRRERRLEVRTARRGDAHDVDIGPRDQRGDVGRVEWDVVLRGEGVRLAGVARGNADECGARERRDGLRVKVGNHTEADDAEAEERGRRAGGHALPSVVGVNVT